MLPNLIINYQADQGSTNSDPGRYRFLFYAIGRIFSDLSDLILGQFGIFNLRPPQNRFWSCFRTVLISGCVIGSAFSISVIRVILGRSNKKMRWPYAGRIITFVTNQHSGLDFSKMKNPRKAMALPVRAIIKELTVSMPELGSSPNPAPSNFRNMFRNMSVFIDFIPKGFGVLRVVIDITFLRIHHWIDSLFIIRSMQ